MPVRRRVVIREKKNRAMLPEWAREGALLEQELVESGQWSKVAEMLHVYRHVGYAAIDAVGFFLHYFGSGQRCSLKEFGRRTTPHRAQLAALGQRRQFPSPSSVSRLLGVVQTEDVRPVGPRLLLETTEAARVLQHPAASVRDTFGMPWHIFDSDATVQAFRERALPKGPELPTPRRRCGEALARRGYAGRKRGELRLSRGTLQHAGTGLWVTVVLSPERADSAAMLPVLLDGLEEVCRISNVPRERAVLRADGGGGNVPWLTGCQQRGVSYLTRWGHYSLLEQADVKQQLARGTWYRVPSSGSGPQREAMDLGKVELHAAAQTRDANGARYEPVRTRIVVSRFRADATSSVGHLMDGWLYELFATDLPVDAWPAPETVAQYFGRSAEENRFAQEDREIGLDHLFSYHLPGQELACLLGLMVWNLRLTRGFALNVPPTQLPPPVPRMSEPAVPEASGFSFADNVLPASMSIVAGTGALADAAVAAASGDEVLSSAAQDVTSAPPTDAATLATTPAAHSLVVVAAVTATLAGPVTAAAPAVDDARVLYDDLDWEHVLTRLGPEWSRAATGDGLCCPGGSILSPCMVRASQHRGGLPSLRLLAPVSACRSCSRRTQCAKTDAPRFAKNVSIPLTAGQAESLNLHLSARTRRSRRGKPPSSPPATPNTASSPRYRAPMLVRPPDDTRAPGPYAQSEARLVPSEFRHAFCRACREVAVAVAVPLYPHKRPLRHVGLALTAVERQRRRRSWQARLLDNALPAALEVSVLIAGPRHALAALGMTASEPPNCRQAQANI